MPIKQYKISKGNVSGAYKHRFPATEKLLRKTIKSPKGLLTQLLKSRNGPLYAFSENCLKSIAFPIVKQSFVAKSVWGSQFPQYFQWKTQWKCVRVPISPIFVGISNYPKTALAQSWDRLENLQKLRKLGPSHTFIWFFIENIGEIGTLTHF